MQEIKIKTALVSAYHKDDQLVELAKALQNNDITIYASGGTHKFLSSQGINTVPLESLTDLNQMLDGRVKTLHPKVFGGILARRETDEQEIQEYGLVLFDLVVVDLYPFGEKPDLDEAVELIDIGGSALIRAAAKNFKYVLVVPDRKYWDWLVQDVLVKRNGVVSFEERKRMAAKTFYFSSFYDMQIAKYLWEGDEIPEPVTFGAKQVRKLRYGENPHQQGWLAINESLPITQLQGKELSYNNLLDVRAALTLIKDFPEKVTCAIFKHTNPCGVAIADTPEQALEMAWASDPESAFGGIIILNSEATEGVIEFLSDKFFEILLVPDINEDLLSKLKKQRIVVKYNIEEFDEENIILSWGDGLLIQQNDNIIVDGEIEWIGGEPLQSQIEDALFAWRVVKHLKSNAIAIAKNRQLIGAGVGQPSRVRAVQHAIANAKKFGFGLSGSVLASDAFFPFPDSVEEAHKHGITVIIQPGGSRNDKQVFEKAQQLNIKMGITGTRHFKHL
ncbi:MAG: bifunctional phosphoribosylaminoimidazolecarboxamide formyltransferase/IMP cyclohydrolase [Chlorobi bacterium]|nr:bifunctional phosphoribosylaminoimidazolecarboxamide formyltransferase/IMP cyclohydrolase [Chlorobiota bacterium]